MEKETLEEAFEQWSDEQVGYHKLDVLRFGAKWQAERMYSEEDMIDFAKFFTEYTFIDNTSIGDLYALDETGNYPAYTMAELISIWKNQK